MLVKRTAVNCLLNQTVYVMSNRKSSLNVKVTTTCFHLHYTAVFNSGSHTEFNGIIRSRCWLQTWRLVNGDWHRIFWSLARVATVITQVHARTIFVTVVFFYENKNKKRIVSQIKYWSWKYSRPILQDRDQDRDIASRDQDRIKLVSSALDDNTAVSRTTSLISITEM